MRLRNRRGRFNSKLVRLEVPNSKMQIAESFVFQFQTGAIRSSYVRGVMEGRDQFQFQIGAIRSETNAIIVIG